MTDKKLTDKEIVKALEGAYKIEPTTMFFITDYNTNKITTIGIGDIVDLITRQQAENENLKVENQSLRSAANSLKMHYEEAQAEIDSLKIFRGYAEKRASDYRTMRDKYLNAKSIAVKEFAGKLENRILSMLTTATLEEKGIICACIGTNNNLLKELVGGGGCDTCKSLTCDGCELYEELVGEDK